MSSEVNATAAHQAEFFPANQADARAIFDKLRSDRQMWQITAKICFDNSEVLAKRVRELETENAVLRRAKR